MRRWLSTHGEKQSHARSRGAKEDKTKLRHRFNRSLHWPGKKVPYSLEIVLAIHERQAELLAVSFKGVSVSPATMGSWMVIGRSLAAVGAYDSLWPLRSPA